MSDLRIPGRPPSDNPLLVLAGKMDEVVTQLKRMNEGVHEYALQPTDEEGNSWLVYCIACSNKQQRYVHPCQVKDADHQVPPSTFVVASPPPAL